MITTEKEFKEILRESLYFLELEPLKEDKLNKLSSLLWKQIKLGKIIEKLVNVEEKLEQIKNKTSRINQF